jgi:hypothetical protein
LRFVRAGPRELPQQEIFFKKGFVMASGVDFFFKNLTFAKGF